jgi:hypothetical protein
MVDRETTLKAISPLPDRLRNRITLALLAKIEEAKEAGKPQTQIEMEVVELILQEIFTNFIQPIEMTKEILISKALKEIPSFKIEFGEMSFGRQFVTEHQSFREDFLKMLKELGLSESFFAEKKQLDWKKEEGDNK